MKRHQDSNAVELQLGPHPARHGWEVMRVNYDAHNPMHVEQIDAALTAIVRARTLKAREASTAQVVAP